MAEELETGAHQAEATDHRWLEELRVVEAAVVVRVVVE